MNKASPAPRRFFRHALTILSYLAVLSISGCNDFFGVADLKELIREDVATATAEEVGVTIQAAEKTSMGTPSPIGAQSYKIGIPYTISTTVGDDYTFLEWTHSGDAGDITFENSEAASTTITVNRSVSGLTMQPTFDRRPFVLTQVPFTGTPGVYRNKTIVITFNEDIDQDTIILDDSNNLNTITIVTWNPNPVNENDATQIPVQINDNFTLSKEARRVTLTPSVNYTENYQILFTLSNDIQDLSGHKMTDEFSSWFVVGNGVDESPPGITALSITTNSGTYNSGSIAYGNTRSFVINSSISDESPVPYVKIYEDDLDGSGNPLNNPVETYSGNYSSSLSYTLSSLVDTKKRILMTVKDAYTNESAISNNINYYCDITYETVTPTASNFGIGLLTKSDIYVASRTVKVWADVTETSVPVVAAFSIVNTGPWSYAAFVSGTTTFTLPDTQGSHTLYARFKDAAGNETSNEISDSIIYDGSAPSHTYFYLASTAVGGTGDAYTTTGTVKAWSDASDASAPVQAAFSLDGGTTWTGYADFTSGTTTVSLGTEGTKTVRVKFRDAAGNETSAVISDSIIYDGSAPGHTYFYLASTLVGGTGDAYTTTGSVKAWSDVSDASAPVQAAFSLDGGTTWTGYADFTSGTTTVSLGMEGTKTVRVKFRDALGNETGAVISDSIIYDGTAPVVSTFLLGSASGDTYTTTGTVKAWSDASDASAPVQAAFSLDGGTTWTGYADFTSGTTTVSLGTEGTKTVRVKFRDAAGNETGAVISDSIIYDGSAPSHTHFYVASAEVGGTGDAYTTTGTVKAWSDASDASTPVQAAFSLDGGTTWTGYADFTSGTTTVSLGTEGTKTVRAKFRDAAGNETGAVISDSIIYDGTAPVVTTFLLGSASGDTYTTISNPKTYSNATDATTGLYVRFSYDGGTTWDAAATEYISGTTIVDLTKGGGAQGLRSIKARFEDAAGNVNTVNIQTQSITYDTTFPTVTNVTSSTANGSYNADDSISIQVTFSENVTVTGTPKLTLELGGTDHDATYDSGTDTNTLTFSYTIVAGDNSGDLDYAGTSALYLNSGTIKDAAGNSATLTLAAPGAAGSLGANEAIIVDTLAPSPLTGTPVAASNGNGTITINSWTNPSDPDRTGIIVTWSTGSATLAADATTYTTPVLTNGTLYTFTIKAVDNAGNLSPGVDVTATPSPSTLTVSITSLESNGTLPVLTYTSAGSPAAATLYYWAGSSFKPAVPFDVPSVDGTPIILSSLLSDQDFSFCLASSNAETITYTFTWTPGSPGSYSAPIARSMAGSSFSSSSPSSSGSSFGLTSFFRPYAGSGSNAAGLGSGLSALGRQDMMPAATSERVKAQTLRLPIPVAAPKKARPQKSREPARAAKPLTSPVAAVAVQVERTPPRQTADNPVPVKNEERTSSPVEQPEQAPTAAETGAAAAAGIGVAPSGAAPVPAPLSGGQDAPRRSGDPLGAPPAGIVPAFTDGKRRDGDDAA